MPAPIPRTPIYRQHKPTGQVVVTLGGRDHYLGRYGSPANRAEYDRLISEWLTSGRRPAVRGGDATVSQLLMAYHDQAR